eukprot:jgi/Mesen1/991/ME000120S00145
MSNYKQCPLLTSTRSIRYALAHPVNTIASTVDNAYCHGLQLADDLLGIAFSSLDRWKRLQVEKELRTSLEAVEFLHRQEGFRYRASQNALVTAAYMDLACLLNHLHFESCRPNHHGTVCRQGTPVVTGDLQQFGRTNVCLPFSIMQTMSRFTSLLGLSQLWLQVAFCIERKLLKLLAAASIWKVLSLGLGGHPLWQLRDSKQLENILKDCNFYSQRVPRSLGGTAVALPASLRARGGRQGPAWGLYVHREGGHGQADGGSWSKLKLLEQGSEGANKGARAGASKGASEGVSWGASKGASVGTTNGAGKGTSKGATGPASPDLVCYRGQSDNDALSAQAPPATGTCHPSHAMTLLSHMDSAARSSPNPSIRVGTAQKLARLVCQRARLPFEFYQDSNFAPYRDLQNLLAARHKAEAAGADQWGEPGLPLRSSGEEIGGARGGSVIFIHGIGSSSCFWRDSIFKALSDELFTTHRIFAPDLLGLGHSPKPGLDECAYTVEDQAAAIRRSVIDAHQLPSYHLVGHSMGCLVALSLAAQAPAAVDSITLLSPTNWQLGSKALLTPHNPQRLSRCSLQTLMLPPSGNLRHLNRLLSNLAIPTLTKMVARAVMPARYPTAMLDDMIDSQLHCRPLWPTWREVLTRHRVDPDMAVLERAGKRVRVIHGMDDALCPVLRSMDLADRFSVVSLLGVPAGSHELVVGREAAIAKEIEKEIHSGCSLAPYKDDCKLCERDRWLGQCSPMKGFDSPELPVSSPTCSHVHQHAYRML